MMGGHTCTEDSGPRGGLRVRACVLTREERPARGFLNVACVMGNWKIYE